jgi:pilus assembly protein CpaE
MSVQSEQHYMKQAMAAGARDFQPKPFTAEELVGCIRRVYQIGLPVYRQIEAMENAGPQHMTPAQQQKAAREQRGAPVIAVYSAKGGIGTSTLAVNLAIALQQMHREIALVDTDLQFGDISVHLNTRPERTIIDAVQGGILDLELIREVMLPHNSGLKLLLAPTQPEMADEITADMIPKIIKELKNHFKVVIIDTTSQLTDKTLNVLESADYILLITTPELPAIKSTKLFLELGQQLEWDPGKIQVIMNRANLPGGIPTANIEKALKISETFPIPYDPRIHTAINKGVAVTQQDSGAPSARAIAHLATTLWDKLTEADAIPELTEMA